MNVEIGTMAAQFLSWEYFFSNFRYCVFAVHGLPGKESWISSNPLFRKFPLPVFQPFYFFLISWLGTVFRIRIHRIHMFLGLPDPDPDPLVRGMNPDPDPSIIMQK